ncbi:MAG: lamin tail domain-containing protein [bacterium]|nr:lamin tail domain-containing protein [bacterium]
MVTWNTRKALADTGSSAFHAAGRILRYLAADIYALQETPPSSSSISNLVRFRDSYLTNYYVVRSGNNDNYNRQAVISRYPIRDFRDAVVNTWTNSGDVVTDYTNKFTRELFYAEIDIPGADPVRVYTVHLKATTSDTEDLLLAHLRREAEARQVVWHLDGRWSNGPAQQIVLCGDMNTDIKIPAHGMAVHVLTNCAVALRLTEAPVNPLTLSDGTYSNGMLRFDYQLPSPRLTDVARSVFRTDVGTPPPGLNPADSVIASDHLPVWYRYTLPAPHVTARERIIITEANLWCNNNSNEYIELYNAGTVPCDLRDWLITDLDSSTVIATTTAVVYPGHFVLIQVGSPAASGTSSAGTGVLRLYVPALSFTGTDDQLALLNTNNIYVDCVLWNNNDASLAAGEVSDFNTLCEYMWRAGAITNVAQYNTTTVRQSGSQSTFGQSLYRLPAYDVYPDSDTTNDWLVTSGTQGTPGDHNPGFVPEPVLSVVAFLLVPAVRRTGIAR